MYESSSKKKTWKIHIGKKACVKLARAHTYVRVLLCVFFLSFFFCISFSFWSFALFYLLSFESVTF